jgi:hypothetical protein
MEDRTVLSTLTVLNNLDSGPGSLRATIAAASSGDTINFAKSVHNITLTSGELEISTNLHINGPGEDKLTINGNNAGRIFAISASASVTIAGLTLTDGLATSGGGILLEGSASLSISNCKLTDNVAVGNTAGAGVGGGIEDSSAGALFVTNCTFDDNEAIATGPNGVPGLPGFTPGVIFAFGGAINLFVESTGSATISNSRFTGNQALGGGPGASAGGGALSNSSDFGATMTVTGCTISGNAAIGATGGDGVINFGSGQGGGINDFASLIVQDSTVADNVAMGTPLAPGAVPSQTVSSGSAVAGGGIFCLTFSNVPATAIVAGCTLDGNQAVGGAGAAGSAGSVGEGGGISLIAVPSALVTGCTLADNVARGGAGGSGAVGAPGVSGGIDLAFGSSVTVSNTFLIDNQAIGGAGGSSSEGGDGVGGGINVGTGVIYGAPDNCSLTLTDSIFGGNLAVGGAGGSASNGGNGSGGGLSVLAGSSAAIDATWIVANAALGGVAGTGGASGQGTGGGLYIGTDAAVTLDTSSVVIFNFASTSDVRTNGDDFRWLAGERRLADKDGIGIEGIG